MVEKVTAENNSLIKLRLLFFQTPPIVKGDGSDEEKDTSCNRNHIEYTCDGPLCRTECNRCIIRILDMFLYSGVIFC